MSNKQVTIISIIVGVVSIIITIIALNGSRESNVTNNSDYLINQNGANNPSIINNKGSININNGSTIESDMNNEKLLKNKPDFIIKKVVGSNVKIIDRKIVNNKFGFDFLLVLYEKFNDPFKEYYLASIKYKKKWSISWQKKFKPVNLRSLSIELSADGKYYTSYGCTVHMCSDQQVIIYSIKNDIGYSFFIYEGEVTVEGDFQLDKSEVQEILEMLLPNVYDPLVYTIDKKVLSYFPTQWNLIPDIRTFFRKKKLKLKKNDKKYSYDEYDREHLKKVLSETQTIISSKISIPEDYAIDTYIDFNFDSDDSLERLVLLMNKPDSTDRFGDVCNYIIYLMDDGIVKKIAQSKESYDSLYCGNSFFAVVKKEGLVVKYFSITQNTGSVFVDGSSNKIFQNNNGSITEIKNENFTSSFDKKVDSLLEKYSYY